MNQVSKDSDGTLFDIRVRTSMEQFTDNPLPFEAAAAVRSAFQAIERLRSHGTDSRGLSSGAFDILLRLNSAESTLGALAADAGVSARNVTGLVDTLQREGLVERHPDPTDRRSVRARITPAGQAWLANFREPSSLAMAATFRGFDADELVQLRHLCLRLVGNIEGITR